MSENLTIDKLLETIKSLPPRETWATSKLLPMTHGISFSSAGENFMFLHPELYAAAMRAANLGPMPAPIDMDDFSPMAKESERLRDVFADKVMSVLDPRTWELD